mgnify:CR=1 FL=1
MGLGQIVHGCQEPLRGQECCAFAVRHLAFVMCHLTL